LERRHCSSVLVKPHSVARRCRITS
jgi:hypothetical protein